MFRRTINGMSRMNMHKKSMSKKTLNDIKKENDEMMKIIKELNIKHKNFKKKI